MSAFAQTGPDGIKTYMSRHRAFQWTLRATFLFFLSATILRRIWSGLAGRRATVRRSILTETRASAAAVIPFIFMG